MPNPVLDRLYLDRTSLLDLVDSVTADAESNDRDLSSAELELIRAVSLRGSRRNSTRRSRRSSRSSRARCAAMSAPFLRERLVAPIVDDRRPTDTDAPIYRTFAQYARDSIVARFDPIAALAGRGARVAAAERIERAVANTLSGDVDGLIPPQHLSQIFDIISTVRPIVQSARNVSLTSGKLTYPDVTQRPLVGKQVGEKTEAPSRKMIVTMIEGTLADTYVGCGDLSWQAINWSTPRRSDAVVRPHGGGVTRRTEAAGGISALDPQAVRSDRPYGPRRGNGRDRRRGGGDLLDLRSSRKHDLRGRRVRLRARGARLVLVSGIP